MLARTCTFNVDICLWDHVVIWRSVCLLYVDHMVNVKHYGHEDHCGGGYPSGCSIVVPAVVGGAVTLVPVVKGTYTGIYSKWRVGAVDWDP